MYKVFCFTPTGEVIKLPRGATPLDFAYSIHTRIGDHCVGTEVDGKRVPLYTRLRNGQSVKIITARGQRPQINWENMVLTGRAKSAIRRFIRNREIKEFLQLGTALLQKEYRQQNKRMHEKSLIKVIASGLPASPGAASGKVVFTSEEAERLNDMMQDTILVRVETSPEDIQGMHAAKGILTARGGMTSHAAVVARGMGRPCVSGSSEIDINYENKSFKTASLEIKEGEAVSYTHLTLPTKRIV